MLNELTAWLETGTYDDGVLLYERAIGPGFLLTMLKRGRDDYNRRKLRDALEAKQAELVQADAQLKASYPPRLKAELSNAGKLMDERIVLKERLRALYAEGCTDLTRTHPVAFRVLAIQDALDPIFAEKHFFDQHRYLPESADSQENRPEELLRRRNTLRTYVTRYTQRVAASVGDDEIQKNEKRLQQYQSELFEVDQLIGALPQ